VKTLDLFFLANFGLCLLLLGQGTAFSENELSEKGLMTLKSENFLSQDSGRNLDIEMLTNPSDMTISESYQSVTQTAADIGARFDIAKIDENLSETLKNDESHWNEINKDDPEIQNRALTPLIIIVAIIALLLVGLSVIRIQSKRP
jgi:hypothetical protein